jgi:hypothetical protein
MLYKPLGCGLQRFLALGKAEADHLSSCRRH